LLYSVWKIASFLVTEESRGSMQGVASDNLNVKIGILVPFFPTMKFEMLLLLNLMEVIGHDFATVESLG
jgi:hypothetical protein